MTPKQELINIIKPYDQIEGVVLIGHDFDTINTGGDLTLYVKDRFEELSSLHQKIREVYTKDDEVPDELYDLKYTFVTSSTSMFDRIQYLNSPTCYFLERGVDF